MVAVTFDTLKFTHRLEKAGLPREQAEAQAEALAEAFKVNLGDLVTKGDLLATKDDLTREVHRLDANLRKDMEVRFAQVDGKLTLLQWMFGALVGLNVAVLLKLFL